jgi:hypothetical protein
LLKHLDARLAAQGRAGFDGVSFLPGDFAELLDVEGLADAAAFADIHTILFIHG